MLVHALKSVAIQNNWVAATVTVYDHSKCSMELRIRLKADDHKRLASIKVGSVLGIEGASCKMDPKSHTLYLECGGRYTKIFAYPSDSEVYQEFKSLSLNVDDIVMLCNRSQITLS